MFRQIPKVDCFRKDAIYLAIILSNFILFLSFMSSCVFSIEPSSIDRPVVTADGSGGAILLYESNDLEDTHNYYVRRIDAHGESIWQVCVGSGYKKYGEFYGLQIAGDMAGGAVVSWRTYPERSEPNDKRPSILNTSYVSYVDSKGQIKWKTEFNNIVCILGDSFGNSYIGQLDNDSLRVLKIDSKGTYLFGEEGIPLSLILNLRDWWMISDKNGGVIVVQLSGTGKITAQKINGNGEIEWPDEGTIVKKPGKTVNIEDVNISDDGIGGVIVTWVQIPIDNVSRDSPEFQFWNIYVQRIDSFGNAMWSENGISLRISEINEDTLPQQPEVVYDGQENILIVWEDFRHGLTSIYAQKIGKKCNFMWSEGGIQVVREEGLSTSLIHSAVTDSSGGVIAVYWIPVDAEKSTGSIITQRIDKDGELVWGDFGMSAMLKRDCLPPAVSADNKGGILISWYDEENINYVQRIDSNGNRVWGDKGITLTP